MYAIAVVRYRKPIADVEAATDEHRAYLKSLHAQGLLLVSGPMVPRNGGVLLFRVPDADANATLDRLRDADPFVLKGIAQYEFIPWAPVMGLAELDGLKAP